MLTLAVFAIAAAIIWSVLRITDEIRAAREQQARGRALAIAHTLAPGIAAARSDPRALLVWQPLARTIRQLLPDECARLDRAAGAAFPFTADQIQSAHAQWTADWLAWERSHDGEYKARARVAEHDLQESGGAPAARARLEAIEREKLELYQRRYQDYVQVAKALQGLIAPS